MPLNAVQGCVIGPARTGYQETCSSWSENIGKKAEWSKTVIEPDDSLHSARENVAAIMRIVA